MHMRDISAEMTHLMCTAGSVEGGSADESRQECCVCMEIKALTRLIPCGHTVRGHRTHHTHVLHMYMYDCSLLGLQNITHNVLIFAILAL